VPVAAKGTLRFGILGPLEAKRGETTLKLGGAKPRALLANLLLHVNQVVSTDKLIDDLWGESPPATVQTTIQVYVLQLRRLLEPGKGKKAPYEVLVTSPPGYVLRLAPDALDLGRFERLAAEGSEALALGEHRRASERLREALALWRGPPLADLAFESFVQAPAARFEELRLAVIERRIEADLAGRLHTELVPELRELCAEYPLREGLAAHLMLALYRSGRQAEALEAYQRTRSRLVDDLGIDPTPALQQLEREILLQDPSLQPSAAPGLPPAGTVALLFTDIEGSTELLQTLGDLYGDALMDHRRLVRDAMESHGGTEIDRQEDGFFFVFERSAEAVTAALEAQQALADHEWPGGVLLRVRMGVHVGVPVPTDGGYVGLDVRLAARICAAGHGGQVLLSEAAAGTVAASEEIDVRELGSFVLKGIETPQRLFQVDAPGSTVEHPPPRTFAEPMPIQAPNRAVLVLSSSEDSPGDLVGLLEPLAASSNPHELILADVLDAQRALELEQATARLHQERDALAERGVVSRTAAFTSNDVVGDVVRLASRAEVTLLALVGPVTLQVDGTLGELLTGVLENALCDVCFLVSREEAAHDDGEGPVLVPFGAGEHDWAALELGAWLARSAGRELRLLGTESSDEAGSRDASLLLADAGLLIQRASDVTPLPRLVKAGQEGIIQATADGGLLIVGLSERWREEGLGPVRWGIARTAPVPVLFVRHGLRPGGLAPSRDVTRFGWSVTVSGRGVSGQM